MRDLVPCAQFKNVKNTHVGMLLLVKSNSLAFTKSNTSKAAHISLFLILTKQLFSNPIAEIKLHFQESMGLSTADPRY